MNAQMNTHRDPRPRTERSQRWRVLTSGPGMTFIGTFDEAKAYVERHAPLKRGWTGEWVTGPVASGSVWRYVRRNSKGRVLASYTVLLMADTRR